MSVYSSFLRLTPRFINTVLFRKMSENRVFNIQPSRHQWNKFKDYFHFYTMLGLIPCSLGLMYVNIFIGPATLSEIPEEYEPKYWEYERHPVSRFIAKYILASPQQDYEKYLAFLFMEHEKTKLRKLEKEIANKMAERNDYQVYYYRPVMGKYLRVSKEVTDDYKRKEGDI